MGVIVPLLWGVNVVSFLAHREREMEAGVYCVYPQHHFHVEIVSACWARHHSGWRSRAE